MTDGHLEVDPSRMRDEPGEVKVGVAGGNVYVQTPGETYGFTPSQAEYLGQVLVRKAAQARGERRGEEDAGG